MSAPSPAKKTRNNKPGPLSNVLTLNETDPWVEIVDLNDLTVGEIEMAEEVSGLPITQAMDLSKPQGRITRAVGYVSRRRSDPDFTWEDAAKLKVGFRTVPVPPTGASAS